mgnify:CR=1 FL=1
MPLTNDQLKTLLEQFDADPVASIDNLVTNQIFDERTGEGLIRQHRALGKIKDPLERAEQALNLARTLRGHVGYYAGKNEFGPLTAQITEKDRKLRLPVYSSVGNEWFGEAYGG